MSERTSRLNIFLKIYEKFGAFKKKHYLCTAFSLREASEILAQTRCCDLQHCSKSRKSLVLNELGRLNIRSDKSEDLLNAAELKLCEVECSRGMEPNGMTNRFSYDVLHACVRMSGLKPDILLFHVVFRWSWLLSARKNTITRLADHQPAMLLCIAKQMVGYLWLNINH